MLFILVFTNSLAKLFEINQSLLNCCVVIIFAFVISKSCSAPPVRRIFKRSRAFRSAIFVASVQAYQVSVLISKRLYRVFSWQPCIPGTLKLDSIFCLFKCDKFTMSLVFSQLLHLSRCCPAWRMIPFLLSRPFMMPLMGEFH